MSEKRFTVDVKRHAVGHIKPQLVALPVILLQSNISLIVNGCMKVGLYHKVDILCIWCAAELCRTYAWTNCFVLNLQVSLNEKSHLLDECDISNIIVITNVFF